MQKFGVLYLNGGCWEQQQLLPRDWVDLSFQPWIRSGPLLREPNYGWYWWQRQWGGWVAHVADGWKGQRIAVFPEQKMVVTMTAILENAGEEARTFDHIVRELVSGALTAGASEEVRAELKSAVREVGKSRRIPAGAENRMVPSVAEKERHRALGR